MRGLEKKKNPVGRPRGTKNKPDAGTKGRKVGRPRKDETAPALALKKLTKQAQANQKLKTLVSSAQEDEAGASNLVPAIPHVNVEFLHDMPNQDPSLTAFSTNLHGGSEEAHSSVSRGGDMTFEGQAGEPARDDAPSCTVTSAAMAPGRTPSPGRMSFPPTPNLTEATARLAHQLASEPDASPTRIQVETEDDLDALLGSRDDPVDDTEFAQLPDDDVITSATPPTNPSSPPPTSNPEPSDAKEARSSMPTWLSQSYTDLCEQLRLEMSRNPSRRPSCYDNGSFFLAPKAPFFAGAHIHQLSPAIFYTPHYFIWLPHLFTKIPCPSCKAASRKRENGQVVMLCSKSFANSPRRAVDLEYNIFITFYRYYCSHSECRKTYQSCAQAILDVLPPPLAAQFTFHLTYRNALTDRVTALLRSSFQRGLGPHPFAELLKSFHIRHFEQLELLYLEMVRLNVDSTLRGALRPHQRFSAWNDPSGYAGYVPSARFFGAFYDNFIEKHAREIDQHMAMLSARVLSIDHSHKVPKHLGKVNGEPVFGALHTTANEYLEVRQMTLTSTKAHDQFMPALARIPHSLRQYGHVDTEAIFTDLPRLDGPELERVFPSLSRDVSRVPTQSAFEPLSLAEGWDYAILDSTFQINTRLDILMQELQNLPPSESLCFGVDMEWSVDRSNGIHGRISLISVAYRKFIYLIRLSKFVGDNGYLDLPHTLLVFLRSARIKKAGVHINGDLTRLFRDCGFSNPEDAPFCGGLELSGLALERKIINRSNISLVDLTARVLRRYLAKDESIQVSQGWDDVELSKAHVQYATLDAFASWSIFDVLTTSRTGEAVTSSTAGGTPVKLVSRDRTSIVALGYVAPDQPKQFDGVNVTKTRLIVNITSILQGAYLVPGDLLKSRQQTPLDDISSSLPFGLLCAIKNLEICSPSELATNSNDSRSAPLPPHPFNTSSTTYAETTPQDLDELTCQSTDLDSTAWIDELPYNPEEEQSRVGSTPDPVAVLHAQQLNSQSPLAYGDAYTRSRVLGDLWHLMDQIKIPVHHGLRRPFSRALRDALLLPDFDDKASVEAVLAIHGVTWDQAVLRKPRWIWKRVKRLVPRPNILYARVSQVYQVFGPLKDATTGQPLFTDVSWEKARNILENIRLGYYSDPPDLELYQVQGKDRDGLTLYRCIRGTNDIEGGIHQSIAKRFGSYNTAPRFAVNLLRDYGLHHNLTVGTWNRTGVQYNGSFDIWTRNRIAKLAYLTNEAFVQGTQEVSVIGWVNGDDFEISSETFGILPLADSTRGTLGMGEFHRAFAVQEKIRHLHLTALQQTRFAILPIHTPNERALFYLLIGEQQGPFSGRVQPNWITLSRTWSQYCDGHTIFYKLPEHLKNYYKTWKENRNEVNSVETYRAAYDQLRTYLTPDKAQMPPIRAAIPVALSAEVNVEHRIVQPEPVNEWEVGILLGRQALQQSGLHFKYVDPTTRTSESSQPVDRKGKKRALPENNSPSTTAPIIKKRAPRTCIRCHRHDCPGAFMRRPCKYRPPPQS